MTNPGSFSATRRRPRPAVLVVVALVHVALFYVLVRALAPRAVQSVERSVVSAFTVSVTAPPEPQPEPAPEEAGAAGEPGREAVPKPVTAPPARLPVREEPVPRASSTGTSARSGASDSGAGTGAGGSGAGTGAGSGGSGSGGGAASKPVLVRTITDVRAFPIPPGGREARIGKSVVVRLGVSAEGRVTSCSVYRPSPFPETDAVVCRLASDQIRFEPARDASGQPVASTFYYQQRFFN